MELEGSIYLSHCTLMEKVLVLSGLQGLCPVLLALSGDFPARAHPMQPLEVVGQADQLPFQLHFLQTSQQELSKAQDALDDPKHRFHRLLPQFVSGPTLCRP